ncbi:uncharacterized protein LOC122258918 [Penaeus japonicus]|uniref:uncharacterized protein LOC122258918 n=1 Tax=Penaeus japonicus TaxID=27405 RepID=UPI001C7148EA|nr:uncharacterized protein LOC122258918 [Penaeus japonicus]
MQLKRWLSVALVAGLLHAATPIILLSSSAAAATTTALTLGVTVSNPALAVVGGAAVLLGAAGLVAAKAAAFRRGRRSATALADDGYSQNAVDVLFAAAGSLDRDSNCGLRLVCELSATPSDQLADDEALIMTLFGSPSIASHDQISSPATPFQLAAFLGRASKSAPVCAQTYAKCHYDSRQIMDILRQNGNGQA